MNTLSCRRWLSAASLLVAAAFAAPAQAGVAISPYSNLVVFGDSLSDSGNNAAALFGLGFLPTQPAAITSNAFVALLPSSAGTYSDGPVWVDAVATALLGSSTPARASLLGGTNYASGGAETSLNTPVPGLGVNTFSLQSQVNFFLSTTGGVVDSSALYVVQGGANNVRRLLETGAAFDPMIVAQEAAAYATDVGNLVDQLQLAGAQDIIVWNTPNVGLTPAALSLGSFASTFSSSIASQFNASLATRLAGEGGVQTFDVFGAFTALAADPAAFGLSNVTDACGNNALGCGSSPLFWDGIHPTAAGHALIAQGVLALALAPVPEPSTYALFSVGLIGCGWVVRRRRTLKR